MPKKKNIEPTENPEDVEIEVTTEPTENPEDVETVSLNSLVRSKVIVIDGAQRYYLTPGFRGGEYILRPVSGG